MTYDLDFVGLHNILKHAIHLSETSDGLLQICDNLLEIDRPSAIPSQDVPSARELIFYNQTAIHSTSLRLKGLDRRINGLINLSFNLVTQNDSRRIGRDSKRMVMIAIITIVFLPTNTIAAIFSGPFFDAEFETSGAKLDRLFMLKQFWVFWAIAVPVTAVPLLLGWWYLHGTKRRRGILRPQVGI